MCSKNRGKKLKVNLILRFYWLSLLKVKKSKDFIWLMWWRIHCRTRKGQYARHSPKEQSEFGVLSGLLILFRADTLRRTGYTFLLYQPYTSPPNTVSNKLERLNCLYFSQRLQLTVDDVIWLCGNNSGDGKTTWMVKSWKQQDLKIIVTRCW
jgi:hypothetical protein